MEIGSNCEQITDTAQSREDQLGTFQVLVDEIVGEFPGVLRKRLAEKELMDSVRWIFEKKKYVRTAQVIFKHAVDLIGAEAGYLALYDEETDEVEMLVSKTGSAVSTVQGPGDQAPPFRGVRQHVLRSLEAVRINEFGTCDYAQFLPAGHVDIESILFVPLIIDGRGCGILGLANKKGGFTSTDVRLLKAFADLGALCLKNSLAWRYLGDADPLVELTV